MTDSRVLLLESLYIFQVQVYVVMDICFRVMEKLYGSIYCTYTPLRIELFRFYRVLKERKVDITSKITQQLNRLGFMGYSQVGMRRPMYFQV